MEEVSVAAPDATPLLLLFPGENGYSTESIRIGPSETGGLGMFAVRNIPKGTCILKEDNVAIPPYIIRERHPDVEFCFSISEEKYGVNNAGPNISKVNHSCSRWNSAYANVNTANRELRAMLPITKGDEITLCYQTLPKLECKQPDGSLETRPISYLGRRFMSQALNKKFGFSCSCKDCVNERICGHCRKTTNLKQCARCGIPLYCSPQCQRAAWFQHHKSECGVLSKTKKRLRL
jgi:hypothetical protein